MMKWFKNLLNWSDFTGKQLGHKLPKSPLTPWGIHFSSSIFKRMKQFFLSKSLESREAERSHLEIQYSLFTREADRKRIGLGRRPEMSRKKGFQKSG